MKIQNKPQESESIGNFEEIDSTINNKDLGIALRMVSKNLYSNPIGSFIRELASNAVDAHVDVKEEAPVLIHLYYEDDSYYLEVKDNGTGMSPETFKTIYMSWFNSDKRNTNSKIGGWGLGSKSPLAYQESFEILTRYDGIAYDYILENAEPVPKSTLVHKEETSLKNGTTIRVEINQEDLYDVSSELRQQLSYFDNVYVKNDIYFYDNHFKVYESDLFKLRNKDFPFRQEMHICLGQVAYPINWNTINLERINIPVALKFEVGELEVTLSREELNYTDEVKEKIREKALLVKEEILSQYDKQIEIKDLFEYIKLVKGDRLPPFKIKDVEIDLNINRELSFSPFPGISLKKDSIKYLFYAYNVAQLKNGKKFEAHSTSSQLYYHLYRNPHLCYIVQTKYNYFDTLFIQNGYLFKKGKITKGRFRDLATALDLRFSKSIYKDEIRVNTKYSYKLGTAILVYKLFKYVEEYLNNTIQTYEGQASKDWIEEIKREQAVKKEETKGTITYYDIYNKRTNIKIEDFINSSKYIFYANKKWDKEKIMAYYFLYNLNYAKFKDMNSFVILNPTNINKLKKFKNLVSVENLTKVKSIKNTLQRLAFIKEVNEIRHDRSLFKYSDYYYNLYTKLTDKYIGEYFFSRYNVPYDGKNSKDYAIDIVEYFKSSIVKTKPLIYEEYLPILKDFKKKYGFLAYMYDIPKTYLIDIIAKYKILKLNTKYYLKPKENE